MRPVRNSAKAIIIHQGKLLALEFLDQQGPWFQLPGGGQQPGETLHQALIRECLEEVNASVKVGELQLVREYIASNHEFAEENPGFHQIEFMFICEILNTSEVGAGHDTDEGQLNVVWLEIDRLEDLRLYPMAIRPMIKAQKWETTPVYLGDVN